MKKIGIITFHRAENYGAIMQSYALVRVLKEFGVDAEVIDYQSYAIDHVYKLLRFHGKHFSARFKLLQNSIKHYHVNRQRIIKFKRFREKYLPMSKPVTRRNISDLVYDKYDAFVTGSDQVFNTELTLGDADNYLLAFVKDTGKKYSYACSFGKQELKESEKPLFLNELRGFEQISVREPSGVRIVEELTGKTAEVHLDPTLLLDSCKWNDIASPSIIMHQPYILLFIMRNMEKEYQYAANLSKKTGLPVVCLFTYRRRVRRDLAPDFIYMETASPDEFITLIKNASYVVTSSFHGVAFSIIFEKKFIAVLKKGKERNERITSLLEIVGLKDRILVDEEVYQDTEIDWIDVKNRLCPEKEKSLLYLKSIIDNSIEKKG